MSHDDCGQQAYEALCRSGELNPNERLLLQLYATIPTRESSGAVRSTAVALAAMIGWTPSLLSQVRGKLVEGGWLEQVDKVSNSPIYRLGERATGKRVVVALRDRTA